MTNDTRKCIKSSISSTQYQKMTTNRDRTINAIKNAAQNLRLSSKMIDTCNLNVRDTMTIDDADDHHKYYHLTRIATIAIDDDIDVIIEYKRSHALIKNSAYIYNRKIKYFDERMMIYRSDKKSSKILKKINDSIVFDRLDIRHRDLANIQRQIVTDSENALKNRMMRFIAF